MHIRLRGNNGINSHWSCARDTFFPVRPKKSSQRKLKHGDKGNFVSPQTNTTLKYLLGSCGTGCRYVGHKLWLCTSCDALFHHLCHGEGRNMNTCKRCTESNNHPESRGEVDLVDTQFPGHGAIAEIRSEFFIFNNDVHNNSEDQGHCEAFGVGCVVGKQKRAPDTFQCCKSCGKTFDIACKRAYAPSCELELECGCISADQVNVDAHYSEPESTPAPNVVSSIVLSNINF